MVMPDEALILEAIELVNDTIDDLWVILTEEPIHIAKEELFPAGLNFTNARAICFIVEEITTQNLSAFADVLNITYGAPEGALGVYDCILHFDGTDFPVYVNLKTSFSSSSSSSNDVSKAAKLIQFFEAHPNALLVVSTIKVTMDSTKLTYDGNISVNVAWLPRIYYNKANHNLQSNLSGDQYIYRTNVDFVSDLSGKVDDAGHRDGY